jgi:hypothetical protein
MKILYLQPFVNLDAKISGLCYEHTIGALCICTVGNRVSQSPERSLFFIGVEYVCL